jgi:hypothetical protein
MAPFTANFTSHACQSIQIPRYGVVVEIPLDTRFNNLPTMATDSCRRRISYTRISLSVARIRFFTDRRMTLNRPCLSVPQQCVDPRKSNVSGLLCPRRTFAIGCRIGSNDAVFSSRTHYRNRTGISADRGRHSRTNANFR